MSIESLNQIWIISQNFKKAAHTIAGLYYLSLNVLVQMFVTVKHIYLCAVLILLFLACICLNLSPIKSEIPRPSFEFLQYNSIALYTQQIRLNFM